MSLPINTGEPLIVAHRGASRDAPAIQAAKMGKKVVLISFNKHVGGLTSGSLTATEIGKKGIGVVAMLDGCLVEPRVDLL